MYQPCGLDLCVNNLHNVKLKLSRCQQNPTAAPGFPIHFGVHILDWRDYIHFGVRILDWRDFIILESVYWTGGTLYILESIYLDWRDFIYFGVYILGLEGLCSFWSLYTGLEGLNSFWSLYTGLEGLFSFWSPYT